MPTQRRLGASFGPTGRSQGGERPVLSFVSTGTPNDFKRLWFNPDVQCDSQTRFAVATIVASPATNKVGSPEQAQHRESARACNLLVRPGFAAMRMNRGPTRSTGPANSCSASVYVG